MWFAQITRPQASKENLAGGAGTRLRPALAWHCGGDKPFTLVVRPSARARDVKLRGGGGFSLSRYAVAGGMSPDRNHGKASRTDRDNPDCRLPGGGMWAASCQRINQDFNSKKFVMYHRTLPVDPIECRLVAEQSEHSVPSNATAHFSENWTNGRRYDQAYYGQGLRIY